MVAVSQSNNKYVLHSNHDERYTYLGLKACIAKLENDKKFNMSGGKQLRDYLPVEKVAKYIVKISLQNKINGIKE